MSARLELAQCEDASFVGGDAVEVAVYSQEGRDLPLLYLVGVDGEEGETVIRPLTEGGTANGIAWLMSGHTVLDAIERLQEIRRCDACDHRGRVEHVNGQGAVEVGECDDCNGRGWRCDAPRLAWAALVHGRGGGLPMTPVTDEDGVDGPFEAAMDVAMDEDVAPLCTARRCPKVSTRTLNGKPWCDCCCPDTREQPRVTCCDHQIGSACYGCRRCS